MRNSQAVNPCRQPLRYYGSKWRIGPWIASFHPPHYHYVSAYGGGANDIFTKPPSTLETYNDLDGNVVNFFRVLREQPEELIKAIELTPFARAELNHANEVYAGSGKLNPAQLSDIEKARLFYVRCQQGRRSGSAVWKVTWRHMVTDGRSKTHVKNWNEVDHLWQTVERLKQIQIECLPALKIIDKYDKEDTLLYLDPPYVHGERWGSWLKAYQFEMSDDDHRELATRLQTINGMAIISGYPSDLYTELYEAHGWRRETTTARTNTNNFKTEAIWINPVAQQRLQAEQERQEKERQRAQRQLRLAL